MWLRDPLVNLRPWLIRPVLLSLTKQEPLKTTDASLRRKLLFGCLYFSEGAPIGFIWMAMPTRLKVSGISTEEISSLMAILVLPWTFKFLWAPLIDLLQGSRWTLRSWIVTAQTVMGLTLLPLLWLDPVADFRLLGLCLLTHAFAAATQDVAIDALCIAQTHPLERGSINGWMQTGMLLGRALLGGGALVIGAYAGEQAVVALLITCTTFSMFLVLKMGSQSPASGEAETSASQRLQRVLTSVCVALQERNTWIGLAFALTGSAAFNALEVLYGPFLIDRGFTKAEVGTFASLPMIGLMVAGSLSGGMLSDRFGRRRIVAAALALICCFVAGLAATDLYETTPRSSLLLAWLAGSAFGIGLFTATSYALFMDITDRQVAATQFSAFMGMTNGCESWSTWVAGMIIASSNYPTALLALCGVSLVSLPLVAFMRPKSEVPQVG